MQGREGMCWGPGVMLCLGREALTPPQAPGAPCWCRDSWRMQLLTATLLLPGANSSSLISTQPSERTGKLCGARPGWAQSGSHQPHTPEGGQGQHPVHPSPPHSGNSTATAPGPPHPCDTGAGGARGAGQEPTTRAAPLSPRCPSLPWSPARPPQPGPHCKSGAVTGCHRLLPAHGEPCAQLGQRSPHQAPKPPPDARRGRVWCRWLRVLHSRLAIGLLCRGVLGRREGGRAGRSRRCPRPRQPLTFQKSPSPKRSAGAKPVQASCGQSGGLRTNAVGQLHSPCPQTHRLLLAGGAALGAAGEPRRGLPLRGAGGDVPVVGARGVLHPHPSRRQVRVRLEGVPGPEGVWGAGGEPRLGPPQPHAAGRGPRGGRYVGGAATQRGGTARQGRDPAAIRSPDGHQDGGQAGGDTRTPAHGVAGTWPAGTETPIRAMATRPSLCSVPPRTHRSHPAAPATPWGPSHQLSLIHI